MRLSRLYCIVCKVYVRHKSKLCTYLQYCRSKDPECLSEAQLASDTIYLVRAQVILF